ncbi:hypothetical protein SY83_05825 [Paenibacillus swuensis]|uniref:DUF2508 domain-containing protein n=2 Tax=Paenibacillus swuensis TaxID=1178515 RepID=A0A172TNV8_9BACL|nr:hypothetical protein SY83_05825 [Paenibacillus swuensis]
MKVNWTWWRKATEEDGPAEENRYLISEIGVARTEWMNAHSRLDYVIEKDQIDYAVFALEAAEKRYEMLLRKAKRAKLTLLNDKTGKVVEA